MNCPVCGQEHVLMGGRFPPHTVLGDPCAGSGGVSSYHADAPAGPPTPVAAADAPLDKKRRKPRSDRGKARGRAQAAVMGKQPPTAAAPEPPETPRPKRSRRGYLVATGEVQAFTTLAAACSALGEKTVLWMNQDAIGAESPTLIVGRALKTKYVPAKTIPATVKVVQ